ncbi:hypothetical protein QJS04_geneDACA011206 [Acorus gramineus]|uniref:Uncharacterized protein n=1 Tax=Acorus gramineus TaxID=55184 RepID=A0AAV9AMF9_ACOGR|nr:hypothetical protein QJS04_geneDACA011206 [Acorus gramineus]
MRGGAKKGNADAALKHMLGRSSPPLNPTQKKDPRKLAHKNLNHSSHGESLYIELLTWEERKKMAVMVEAAEKNAMKRSMYIID